MLQIARRLFKTARPAIGRDAEALLRWLAGNPNRRKYLNFLYRRLSTRQKQWFHSRFSRLFADSFRGAIREGSWVVDFAGKRIRLPLTANPVLNEWGLALAILGHEPDIKVTYENCLALRRPEVFFDVGANYGTHSLLFLSHGVKTVTFEPNLGCHEYLRRCCVLNELACDIRPLALGADPGWVDFWFPDPETWLGTTDPAVRDRLLQEGRKLEHVRVEQTTLDSFVASSGYKPSLIKIDTEGNEMRVLCGARDTLRGCRPWVIFETFMGSEDRPAIYDLFAELNYDVCALPLPLHSVPSVMGKDVFRTSSRENFIALPAEEARGKPSG